MKILLTNDDGFQAEGIRCLFEALSREHEVVVVAPQRNRSAASHSLTLDRPLRPHICANGFIYVEHATPADCVHIALSGLLDFVPDLVVSGINAGANLGDDTLYSGTVAAAMEGRFLNNASIAVSAVEPFDYPRATEITVNLTNILALHPVNDSVLLNVNVPGANTESRGLSVTRLGCRHKAESAIKMQDPSGQDVYWIGDSGAARDDGQGTDFHAIANGYASITPLTCDRTEHRMLKPLQKWAQMTSEPVCESAKVLKTPQARA